MLKFGQVFGTLVEVDEVAATGRIMVTLDTRNQVQTIRDDRVTLQTPTSGETLSAWNCDQYTQETIATMMAEEGWEVFGRPEGYEQLERDGISSYLVRML